MLQIRIAAILCLAALGCLIATSQSGPRKLSSFDPQVNALLAKMTLDEKVGQMTQPDQLFLKSDEDIAKYYLGSVLSGGDSDPKDGNSLEAWTNLIDRYMKRSLETRLAIPLLYGVDAVHGHNNVLGAVVFPHNIGLGATRNPALIEKIARITALEVRATGINWGFAPCVAVPRDIRWGRTYEGYADEPDGVKELGAAAVRGLQGDDLSDPLSILACAKHYVGDGGTAYGSSKIGPHLLDQGDTRLDEQDPARHPSAGLHHRHSRRCGFHHAVLYQLERFEMLGQPAAAHGNPERRIGLRRLPDFRLWRHRRAARRLQA